MQCDEAGIWKQFHGSRRFVRLAPNNSNKLRRAQAVLHVVGRAVVRRAFRSFGLWLHAQRKYDVKDQTVQAYSNIAAVEAKASVKVWKAVLPALLAEAAADA